MSIDNLRTTLTALKGLAEKKEIQCDDASRMAGNVCENIKGVDQVSKQTLQAASEAAVTFQKAIQGKAVIKRSEVQEKLSALILNVEKVVSSLQPPTKKAVAGGGGGGGGGSSATGKGPRTGGGAAAAEIADDWVVVGTTPYARKNAAAVTEYIKNVEKVCKSLNIAKDPGTLGYKTPTAKENDFALRELQYFELLKSKLAESSKRRQAQREAQGDTSVEVQAIPPESTREAEEKQLNKMREAVKTISNCDLGIQGYSPDRKEEAKKAKTDAINELKKAIKALKTLWQG